MLCCGQILYIAEMDAKAAQELMAAEQLVSDEPGVPKEQTWGWEQEPRK